MFSCLRRSDRRESDGMGHVCIVEQWGKMAIKRSQLLQQRKWQAQRYEEARSWQHNVLEVL